MAPFMDQPTDRHEGSREDTLPMIINQGPPQVPDKRNLSSSIFYFLVISIILHPLFQMKLPYDPVCPSVGWEVGWSVIISISTTLAPIGALVYFREPNF